MSTALATGQGLPSATLVSHMHTQESAETSHGSVQPLPCDTSLKVGSPGSRWAPRGKELLRPGSGGPEREPLPVISPNCTPNHPQTDACLLSSGDQRCWRRPHVPPAHGGMSMVWPQFLPLQPRETPRLLLSAPASGSAAPGMGGTSEASSSCHQAHSTGAAWQRTQTSPQGQKAPPKAWGPRQPRSSRDGCPVAGSGI